MIKNRKTGMMTSKCGVESIRYLTIDFSLLGDMQSEKISAWDK